MTQVKVNSVTIQHWIPYHAEIPEINKSTFDFRLGVMVRNEPVQTGATKKPVGTFIGDNNEV